MPTLSSGINRRNFPPPCPPSPSSRHLYVPTLNVGGHRGRLLLDEFTSVTDVATSGLSTSKALTCGCTVATATPGFTWMKPADGSAEWKSFVADRGTMKPVDQIALTRRRRL